MKRLFIIAGCNGAGKTTASYTVLPEILKCHEFVNADEIARGLSPLNPDSNAFYAGRLMLERIKELVGKGSDFAFETTLSTKSYKNLIVNAKREGYEVALLFFYLNSPSLAIKRVEIRVKEGGHDIPIEIIKRRYEKGLRNFFGIFKPIVDRWIFIDNSKGVASIVARGNLREDVLQVSKWSYLKENYDEGRR